MCTVSRSINYTPRQKVSPGLAKKPGGQTGGKSAKTISPTVSVPSSHWPFTAEHSNVQVHVNVSPEPDVA